MKTFIIIGAINAFLSVALGAFGAHALEMAPVTADPATKDGMTLIGSLIMNGIAPSVIPANPRSHVCFPISCSCLEKYFFPMMVAPVTANAETILTEAKVACHPCPPGSCSR